MIATHGHYWAIIGLMMLGLYIAFASENLIKRMTGVSVFQTSICLLYVALAKVSGGTAPILFGPDMPDAHASAPSQTDASLLAGAGQVPADLVNTYSNPLPHVLMLTAIVVGVATLSVGLAIIVRIREAYGTIEADEVLAHDLVVQRAEMAAAKAEAGETR
jgi:multicomponent Na+:H+ antiporter subunit C